MTAEDLIVKIVRRLEKNKIPYMIIGGQAVALYGRVRFTNDIDITLGIDSDQFDKISKVCKEAKLNILPPNPIDFVNQTKVLPTEDTNTKLRVDFIFSFMPFERQALKRIKKVIIKGQKVNYASCEDIIIHKIIAARAIDEEDVKNILAKQGKDIDFKYIKYWLKQFDEISEFTGVLKKFEKLLKE